MLLLHVWLRTGRPGDRGSIPDRGESIFPLASVSRPVLGPTQPPVQWVPGVLSPGLNYGQGVTLTTHPHLVSRSRMSRSYTSSPPSASVECSGTALALAITTGYLSMRHGLSSYQILMRCVKCSCKIWAELVTKSLAIHGTFRFTKLSTWYYLGPFKFSLRPHTHILGYILILSFHLPCGTLPQEFFEWISFFLCLLHGNKLLHNWLTLPERILSEFYL
jgi:hypothetical protein